MEGNEALTKIMYGPLYSRTWLWVYVIHLNCFLPQEKVEEERQGINDLRAENLQGGLLT